MPILSCRTNFYAPTLRKEVLEPKTTLSMHQLQHCGSDIMDRGCAARIILSGERSSNIARRTRREVMVRSVWCVTFCSSSRPCLRWYITSKQGGSILSVRRVFHRLRVGNPAAATTTDRHKSLNTKRSLLLVHTFYGTLMYRVLQPSSILGTANASVRLNVAIQHVEGRGTYAGLGQTKATQGFILDVRGCWL